MKRHRTLAICVATVASVLAVGDSFGAKFNRVVDIGEKAPAFQDLIGVDGEKHSLNDYSDAKIVVVTFTCNSCPVAQSYEERFIKFTEQYTDKGVAFVAINCNTIRPDKLDAMKERAEDRGFNFDYLYDPSQETGRKYGATVTPHVFVLDRERKIAYMGAVDDNWMKPSLAEEHYLRDAVDSLLQGESPEITETRQIGCNIKYN